jgi:serine/threonine-protein kinase
MESIAGYMIRRKIADGGCGEIYEAQDVNSRKNVAIKILHPRHHGNKREAKRLFDEGALGLRLRHHDHLVQTLKVGQISGRPYVVLELAPGESLRQIVRTRKLKDYELLRLAVAMTKALQHMHERGVYHKDIKPDNIMMDEKRQTTKLLDLGFAETRLRATFSFMGRTLEGSVAYMAPEMLLEKRVGPATDIYSLGCTLYEAATGTVPFNGISETEIMSKQTNLRLRPNPISDLNPDVPFQTQKVILTALEKRESFRFRTANELWLELSRHPTVKHGFVSL